MRILISGAGIAGLTLAYWLKHYGFTPTIIERAPHLPTGGYKIDIRGTAIEILNRMGLYQKVVACSTNMQEAILIDKQGKVLHKMSGDAFGHRSGDDIEIIRGELCKILMEQISNIEYIFEDDIKAISQTKEKVKIKFKKNKSREFDLLIGADGLHSNVRTLVFGDEKNYLENLGLYLAVFTAPNDLNLSRTEIQYTEFGKVASIWSADREPELNICFGFTSKSPIPFNRKAQEKAIQKKYKDMGWVFPKMLKKMQDSPKFYFDNAAQIHMPSWFLGRVVLVGDAAYCASPMSGQGCSLALVGAYILAGELRLARGDYHQAFVNYEKLMRPFVKRNQQLGKKSAELMRSHENPNLFSKFMHYMMQKAPGFLTSFFIHRATRRIHKAAHAIHLKKY